MSPRRSTIGPGGSVPAVMPEDHPVVSGISLSLFDNYEEWIVSKARHGVFIPLKKKKSSLLGMPLELRNMIYKYTFGETLQINHAGTIRVPEPSFFNLRWACKQISNETKDDILIPWITFRVDTPATLRVWLARRTNEQRAAVRSLKLDHGNPWNSDSEAFGWSQVDNPVGRCPPWFTELELSLEGDLPGLKRIHLQVSFDTGKFVGFCIPGRREFILEKVHRALEDWRLELKSWNRGVTVRASSDSLQRSAEVFKGLVAQANRMRVR